MDKQIIISVGREFGSGGHEVARKLAAKLDIQYYDRSLLDEFADQNDLDAELLQKYDEAPKFKLFSRTVRGYSNSPSENIAEIQTALLRTKAVDEDSFVIVGRCAEEVLKDFDCLVSIFISADHADRIKHVSEKFNISEKEAEKKMARHDKHRKAYHDHFANGRIWGDSRTYDVCINVSRLGIDKTVDYLYDYIMKRFAD